MSNVGHGKKFEHAREKVLLVASRMFLEKGYSNTTIKAISAETKLAIGSIVNVFRCKEDLLSELFHNILESQFVASEKLLDGVTEDKVLFYAFETVLQLHIAESSEHMRELYSVAYSMPKTAEIIYRVLTNKLAEIFKEYLPDLEMKDFYEREIASGGIMRGFMTVPCGIYFTMDRKIKAFLETTFLVYEVPKEKIAEAIEFVSRFDFKKIAAEVIENMFAYLESKI